MDWIEKMNAAIIYIEQHITDTLNTEDIAKIVDCSTYHFQRMFAYMTGVPLSEYIVDTYTWAVFSYEGKSIEETQDLGKRVISEWLPTSGYEYDNGPDISVHVKDATEKAILEYWLPIKKSSKSEDKMQ